jgi:hypothetical protein
VKISSLWRSVKAKRPKIPSMIRGNFFIEKY